MTTLARNSCRHCLRRPSTRPRNLCRRCYEDAAVRDLHPSESKFSRQGACTSNVRPVAMPEPTTAVPGSPEKIAVLAERARLGQQLYHPLDATLDGVVGLPGIVAATEERVPEDEEGDDDE